MPAHLLWPKILVELFLLLLFALTVRLKNEKPLTVFGYIIAVLVARDILFSLFIIGYIIPLSEFVVVSLYLLWLRKYTGNKNSDRFYLFFNILFFSAVIANTYFHIVNLPSYLLNLAIIADIIYLALCLGLVSEYNTEKSEIILKSRNTIITVFALFSLITLLFGYENRIVQLIVIPAYYFMHAYILSLYIISFYSEKEETINFISSNLETMFDFMKNFGNALTNKINLEEILHIIVSSAVNNIGADAGVILMVDEYEDKLNVRATQGLYPPLYEVPDVIKVKASSVKRYFSDTTIIIGQTILGEAAETGKPIFIRNSSEDERMQYNTGNDILYISSVIVVPLIVSGRILGVLSTVKRIENQYFSERDVEHLKTFADAASVTIDNLYTYMEVLEKREIEQDVDTAAEIQQKLLPADFPEIQDVTLAAFNHPAKGVSGDYFDMIKFDNDQIGLFICDVAGKGVSAALVMVMIRTILRLIVAAKHDPATILTWINKGITGSISTDHFATLCFLTYNRRKQEIVYSNAAHLPVLVFKNNENKFIQVDTPGLPIGVESTTKYAQRRFKLNTNDLVVLYTDGIIEAMDIHGNQYSLQSLTGIIRKHKNLPAQEIAGKIESGLKTFTDKTKQHDDQTLIVMKIG